MVTRSNPIPETLEKIPGFGTLCIYMTPSSHVYQMRCYLGRKLIKRTTKTDKRGIAITTAKQFYNECLVKQTKNEPLTQGNTFKTAADALLEEDRARVDRGERRKSLLRDGDYIVDHLTDFFKHDHVGNIDFQRITAYMEDMKTRGKKEPSSATVKNHTIFPQQDPKASVEDEADRQDAYLSNRHTGGQSTRMVYR